MLGLLMMAALAVVPVPQNGTAACPGAEDFVVTKVWEFNEPTGSTVFHEGLHANPLDNLTPVPGSVAPYASGEAVWFNNKSVLTTSGNIFNPRTTDYAWCVKFSDDADDDGHNVWQVGNRHTLPASYGMVKAVGYYTYVETTTQRFYLRTGYSTVRGLGYHSYTQVRRGNVFYTYFDGILKSRHWYSGDVGDVRLNQRMVVGGKVELGAPGHSSDMLKGRVASVRLATRQ